MGRNVFMSVLGTGLYGECIYAGEKSETATRFIQEATLNEIEAMNWTDADAAYILVTKESREKNWDVAGGKRADCKTQTQIEYPGLKKKLDNMHLPFEVVPVDIPEGSSDKEMWELFEMIYGLLEEGDQLYFDLTHGFRYIPMMVLTIGSYAGFLKHTQIQHISYGNYEARERAVNGDAEEDKAPIVNLMPLAALQDWTFAAGQFVESGNANRIKELSEKEYRPILKASAGQDQPAKAIQQYVDSLCCTISERTHCRGIDILNSSSANILKECTDNLKNASIPALDPIIGKVSHSLLCGLSTYPDIRNLYVAAQWCAEKGLYQQAVTILREAIVTLLCERHGLDIKSKEQREYAETALRIKCDNQDIETMTGKSLGGIEKEQIMRILEDGIFNGLSVSMFQKLRGLRNDYNHCGMRDKPSVANRMDKCLKDILSSFETIFISEKKLINYSNHPSRNWGESQLAAAKEYGDIIDLSFPKVNPEDNNISSLVNMEFEKLKKMAAGKDATIHIMGEMTLCFALVQRLKSIGIRCVASTTKRANNDSEEFEFVSFREYE